MKKKVLLMGKSGSGKTSMRSIIFANYIARDTRRLGATIDVEHSHVRFLGNLVLNLWDCGGQEAFMENYFDSQRDQIFKNVEVLIYVFDIESREVERDFHYYTTCLEAIKNNSPDARIFCLIHKMDLIQEDQRETIFREREAVLKQLSRSLDCLCFKTSIWDETLYAAWSEIMYRLIPNISEIEFQLEKFRQTINANEVLLFEKATFLVIAKAEEALEMIEGNEEINNKLHFRKIPDRFEKISNIFKQFKMSCSKVAANFCSIEVRNKDFACFIEPLTQSTYVMVVLNDITITSELTLMNIKSAQALFSSLEGISRSHVESKRQSIYK